MQLSTLWIFDHCYYYYYYLGVRSIGKFGFHLDLRISNQTQNLKSDFVVEIHVRKDFNWILFDWKSEDPDFTI